LAHEGGDDVVRAYCRRIGIPSEARLLEALTMAYWLDYVSYRLQTHPHQRFEPRWLERNVSLVLDAVPPLSWMT
jgi:hypothetical protein